MSYLLCVNSLLNTQKKTICANFKTFTKDSMHRSVDLSPRVVYIQLTLLYLVQGNVSWHITNVKC